MSATRSGLDGEVESEPTRRVLVVVAGLCLGLLLAALDQTVFATALPTVSAEFGDPALIGWLNTAYVLAATLAMPAYGLLGDLYGRRRAYVIAMLIFIGASVAAALSSTASGLVWARFVQGLGGGGLLVLVQAVVADLVPARRRAPYLALIGAVFAASSIAGPLLGGALTETVGWRWIFWINVPFGLIAVVTCLATYREGARPAVRTPAAPWRRLAERDIVLATTSGMFMAVAMFGTIAYLPTYLQLVGGLSPTNAGLFMMALAAGIAAATLSAAQILRRTGRYRALPIVGAALAAAAVIGLATRPADGSLLSVGVLLVVLGIGIGCTWDVLLLVVQNASGADAVGTATAVYGFFREVGVTLGTALIGALFASRLSSLMSDDSASVADTYHDALLPALAATIPFLLVAAVLLCFLTGRRLQTRTDRAETYESPVQQR